MEKHLSINPDLAKTIFQDLNAKGKVCMLNLLKFREIADYSDCQQLNPGKEITGKEAYGLYMKGTQPLLDKFDIKVLYSGKCNNFLIGPSSEQWDVVLLVEYTSIVKFREFVTDPEYLKITGHRTAALEDSRLLPSSSL